MTPSARTSHAHLETADQSVSSGGLGRLGPMPQEDSHAHPSHLGAPLAPAPRHPRLRQVVAAALALPLVLGGMAATALPATAGEAPVASISHVGTATVGVTTSATFSCTAKWQQPVVAAVWYINEHGSDPNEHDNLPVVNPNPGAEVFSFTRDFVFATSMVIQVTLVCYYDSYLGGTIESYKTTADVTVTEALHATTPLSRSSPRPLSRATRSPPRRRSRPQGCPSRRAWCSSRSMENGPARRSRSTAPA